MRKILSLLVLVFLVNIFVASAKDKITIGATAYINYAFYQVADDSNAATEGGASEFYNSRMYIDLQRKDENSLFRYTADIDAGDPKGSNGKGSLYTKYLYFELTKLMPDFKLRMGQIGTPWPGWADKIQDVRYIEKSLSDKNKVLDSADKGLGATYKTDMFTVEAAIVNGEGYKSGDVSDNRVDIAVRADMKYDNFIVGAHVQASGTETIYKDKEESNLLVANALVAYKDDMFTVGLEGLTGQKAAKRISGGSLFASVKFMDDYRAFARYDSFDPDTEVEDNITTMAMIGIEAKIADKIRGSLNIKSETPNEKDDSITTVYINTEIKI